MSPLVLRLKFEELKDIHLPGIDTFNMDSLSINILKKIKITNKDGDTTNFKSYEKMHNIFEKYLLIQSFPVSGHVHS